MAPVPPLQPPPYRLTSKRPSHRTGLPWQGSNRGLDAHAASPRGRPRWRGRGRKTTQVVVLVRGGTDPRPQTQQRVLILNGHDSETKSPPDAPWRDEGDSDEEGKNRLIGKDFVTREIYVLRESGQTNLLSSSSHGYPQTCT